MPSDAARCAASGGRGSHRLSGLDRTRQGGTGCGAPPGRTRSEAARSARRKPAGQRTPQPRAPRLGAVHLRDHPGITAVGPHPGACRRRHLGVCPRCLRHGLVRLTGPGTSGTCRRGCSTQASTDGARRGPPAKHRCAGRTGASTGPRHSPGSGRGPGIPECPSPRRDRLAGQPLDPHLRPTGNRGPAPAALRTRCREAGPDCGFRAPRPPAAKPLEPLASSGPAPRGTFIPCQ